MKKVEFALVWKVDVSRRVYFNILAPMYLLPATGAYVACFVRHRPSWKTSKFLRCENAFWWLELVLRVWCISAAVRDDFQRSGKATFQRFRLLYDFYWCSVLDATILNDLVHRSRHLDAYNYAVRTREVNFPLLREIYPPKWLPTHLTRNTSWSQTTEYQRRWVYSDQNSLRLTDHFYLLMCFIFSGLRTRFSSFLCECSSLSGLDISPARRSEWVSSRLPASSSALLALLIQTLFSSRHHRLVALSLFILFLFRLLCVEW